MRLNRTAWFCLFAVYVIWGSTYLAIRYGLESLPPWTLTSLRFFLAAFLMWLLALRKAEDKLKPMEARIAGWSGVFLILANGIVCVSEQSVSSGLVAVIIGAMPIWIMLTGWLGFGEARPSGRKIAGALVGLAGIALIAADHLLPEQASSSRFGILILFLSSALWSTGTLLQRRVPGVRSACRFSAWQMLSGGVAAGLFSLGFEKPWAMNWAEVTTGSWAALAYLVVFGSLIAFTAYAWLGRNLEPHIVSTYALVNPVIAVGLGWQFMNEAVDSRFFMATLLVLFGLLLLMWRRSPRSANKS